MKKVLLVCLLLVVPASVMAQDQLPYDNGLASYHTAPRYRESESHPLRVLGYIVHPVGWALREVIFRPLSYFAASTDVTRSVMGFREPFDYRQPECFSADSSAPDCRSVAPFNYGAAAVAPVEAAAAAEAVPQTTVERQVYLPDVNFDFDKHSLNDLGRGRVHQIANLLKQSPGLRIVLEGNTDYIGSDQYNQTLGTNRAETVRRELVALGVSPETLSTVSFGKSQPALPEPEPWASAVNRRVEVRVQEAATAQ